jgi:hypothetical protein
MTSIAVCLAILSLLIGMLHRREVARQVEMQRLAELDRVTVASIVDEVEAIRVGLGRAPNDEAEVESHLGKPMPVVHDGKYPTPINYSRTGENSFILQYELWATDDWIYNSENPSAGWVQHFY